MNLFTKDGAAGRNYTELLQKKANEKVAGYKKAAAGYKETLEQYEKNFQEKSAELQQIAGNLAGLQEQKEDLQTLKEDQQGLKADMQFVKEKQEYVLRNFPTLEGNIVEKIKGNQANNTQELIRRLDEMERLAKKRNVWTRIILWISLVCSLASVSGVAVILLYLADIIVF